MVVVKEKPDEKFAIKIEKLNARFLEIKKQMSGARKEGKDMLMVDFQIRDIPSKIQYAEVTRLDSDIKKVEDKFKDIEKELKEALGFEQKTFKEEVEEIMLSEGKPLKEQEEKKK